MPCLWIRLLLSWFYSVLFCLKFYSYIWFLGCFEIFVIVIGFEGTEIHHFIIEISWKFHLCVVALVPAMCY